MTGQEQALLVLATAGVLIAAWALLMSNKLKKLERQIADEQASSHPAE